jgi:4-amino-4-deoxy-L-arabinose transferase-like glycosyltransferase
MSVSKVSILRFGELVRKGNAIHLFALSAIFFLGVTVRLVFLFQPMRYDEAFSFTYYASKPLALGLSDYSYPNNHLFHTFLVHLAYLAFGNQPWVIRLPALIAGIVLIPASYLMARMFYNEHAALLSAGVIASSSVLVEYSTNARGYTLMCLIFLLVLAIGTFLIKEANLATSISLGVMSAMGFYTIPIMLYPFGIVAVWLLLANIYEETHVPRRLLFHHLSISFGVGGILTFILYLPVFFSSGLKSVFANRFVLSKAWDDFLVQFPPSLLSVWNQWDRDVPFGISVLLVIGFFVSLIFHRRLSHYRVPLVAAVVAWLVPILAVQRVVPFERVWLFLFPLFVVVASSGVIDFFRLVELNAVMKSLAVATLSLTVSFWLAFGTLSSQSVYYSNETGTFRDAEAMAIFLKSHMKPGDRVLAGIPSDAPLIYYFNLHDIPLGYFKIDMDSAKRILMVVNEPNHQTVGGFLDRIGLALTEFSIPKVVRSYESATLYQMDRAM